jgi:hypothetical protein
MQDISVTNTRSLTPVHPTRVYIASRHRRPRCPSSCADGEPLVEYRCFRPKRPCQSACVDGGLISTFKFNKLFCRFPVRRTWESNLPQPHCSGGWRAQRSRTWVSQMRCPSQVRAGRSLCNGMTARLSQNTSGLDSSMDPNVITMLRYHELCVCP